MKQDTSKEEREKWINAVQYQKKAKIESKQELIDGLIEWAEKNAWIGDVYKTTGRILYLSDLIHHLNSLK